LHCLSVMNLYRKVRAVERVFRQLEKDVASFQQATQLQCAAHCGLCCHKTDISATPLEFLPLAYQLYKQGEALKLYEQLSQNNQPKCVNLKSLVGPNDSGFCSQYAYRGLICRLFGFSAMLDKHGAPKLVTCQTIKSKFPEAVEKAQHHIAEGSPTPIMRNYYFQLRAIDDTMGTTTLPINHAILEALKTVLSYYSYRNPPKAS